MARRSDHRRDKLAALVIGVARGVISKRRLDALSVRRVADDPLARTCTPGLLACVAAAFVERAG